MSLAAITKLVNILTPLKEKALSIDKSNEANKAHRLLENNVLFSINLFKTKSDKYFPYILETEQRIKELEFLLAKKKNEISLELLRQIELQLNALFNAISSNNVMHQEAKYRQEKLNKIKYKNMAKKVMLSSHQLYSKLSEYQEFERRLTDMLNQKNMEAQTKNNPKYSQEALVIHQRLGRCRQAISKVEREIELSEKSKLN